MDIGVTISKIRSRFGPAVRKLAYFVLIVNILLVVFTIGLIKTHSFHADYIYRQLDARLGLSNILHIPEIIGYQLSSTFTDVKSLSITTSTVATMELEQMRLAAINGEKDFRYVPGDIGLDGELFEARIRLKGDRDIHFKDPSTTSFRVKLNGSNTIMGMKTFSLHKPRARNYLDEWIYLQMMREEGLIAPRYEFVTLSVNGTDRGLYVVEEHYTKYLLEKNQKKEGPILKFETSFDYTKADISTFESKKWSRKANLPLRRKAIKLLDGFRSGNLTAVQTFDVHKLGQFFAISDLCAARHGSVVKSMRLYYNPITSKLEPIPFDGHRGTNRSQYYLLAQIGIDRIENWIHDYFGSWFREFFNSEERYSNEFYSAYITTLERISRTEYLDQFFTRNEAEIEQLLELIYSEFPGHDNVFSYGPFPYYFDKDSYYKDQAYIQHYLERPKLVAKLIEVQDSSIIIDIKNNHIALPYEILNVSYKKKTGIPMDSNNIMVVTKSLSKGREFKRFSFAIVGISKDKLYGKKQLTVKFRHPGSSTVHSTLVELSSEDDLNEMVNDPARMKSNMKDFSFININADAEVATIRSGTYDICSNLIIPEGYVFKIHKGVTLNLLNKSLILSRGALNWIGTQDQPIIITSPLDERGQGLVVIDASNESELVHVHFNNLASPDISDWSIPGTVSFYQSNVAMRHVTVANNDSEDGLNITRSKFTIDSCTIKNTRSDGIDIDFGQGEITNTLFSNIGNDAIDVSGTELNVSYIQMDYVADKGMSIGEKSVVQGSNIIMNDAEIGITSKDNSNVTLSDVRLENCKLAFAVFQKKSEYAPSSLTITNGELLNIHREHAIEFNSTLSLNGELMAGDVESVVTLLNGTQYGSRTIK